MVLSNLYLTLKENGKPTTLVGHFMAAACQTSSCKHLNGDDMDRVKGMEYNVHGRIAL